MIHFSMFFYGLVVGSLICAVILRSVAIPQRAYHAVLLAIILVGLALQMSGY